MRVAIVSTPFIRVPPSGYGGTELFCYELAEELALRRHDVTLFTTGDSVTSCRRRALYLRPQWPPTVADELNHVAWAMAEIVRQGGFDVVHLNCPHAVPLSRFVRVPIVYTLHHRREEALSRIYAIHTDLQYVAISRRQLEIEVPLPHAEVVHHGVSVGRYPPSFGEQGYLAHIGRYSPEKGTHLAIDAARAAGLPLKLAGRTHPQDVPYFEEYVAPRLGLPGITDIGEVAHDQKVALLRGARALVCPLQWEEPFGLIAIEAMLCGTPVIGFPRGSFPEIIDEGVTGFLAPDGDIDAMARIASALEGFDRASCARRARDRFGVDVMVTAYEAIYRSTIARELSRADRAEARRWRAA